MRLSTLIDISCLLLSIVTLVQGVSPATTGISPIKSFEPSYTASTAQGTIVAVAFPLNTTTDSTISGVVILSVSNANAATRRMYLREDEDSVKVHGLHVIDEDILTLPRREGPRQWQAIGREALCCITGFVVDADHVARLLQAKADAHRILHEGSTHLPLRQIVDDLSSELREATESEGGRTLGVQALLVGLSSRKDMSMYSLDPSGGFRHWGAATSIGKAAMETRKKLWNHLRQGPVQDGKSALLVAVESLCDQADSTLSISNFDAVLVTRQNERICVFPIHPKQISDCFEEVTRERS